MDCGLAREHLDVARPDSADRETAELEAAFSHVDSCPECAEVVEFRREFDRRTGAVVRDVPVPAGLKERLLAAAELTAPPSQVAQPPRPSSRRKLLLATSSAAALLIAAGIMWIVGGAPDPLAMNDVRQFWTQQLAEDASLDSLPAFDGSFDAAIPDLRWAGNLPGVEPQGADIDGDGRHDAAVYQFGTGFLVVFPPDRIADAPAAESPFAAERSYAPVLHVAWTDAGQVHLCFVRSGGERGLDAILNRVYGAHA